jgi:hypothetical protein
MQGIFLLNCFLTSYFILYFYPVGHIWTKNKYSSESFEIEVALKITGQGRVGADGMVGLRYYCELIAHIS